MGTGHRRGRIIGIIGLIAGLVALVVPAGVASAAPSVGRGAGSVTQAYLLDATPGASVRLRGPSGATVGAGRVDRLGSFIVRDLPSGPGYHFEINGRTGNTFAVLDQSAPDRSLYTRQSLKPGLNYIRMRDGVELAAVVRLPVEKTMADGPFPTVVEHSGYQIAAPDDFLVGGVAQLLKRPDPLAHVFRAGSRIRVTITAPGGDRTSWRFATPATGGRVVDTLGLGAGGSSLDLPIIADVDPHWSPDCRGLRGQPCRRYVPAFNGG